MAILETQPHGPDGTVGLSKHGYPVETGLIEGSEIPAYVMEDLEDHLHDALVDRMTAKVIDAILKRNGIPANTDGSKVVRTEQSLDIYDQLGKTSNPAQGEYAADLTSTIKRTIKDKTKFMTSDERMRAAMVLPPLVGALILDEEHVDKAYDKTLPNTVGIALDWIINPSIIDQTHIRVGFGGEEVTNSRAPAYIVPALETQLRVRDIFTRYGNWAIHQEMVNQIQASVSEKEEQREKIAQLNGFVAAQLAEYEGEQSTRTNAELMEEISNISARHQIPGHLKRDILLTTWQEAFGEPLDVSRLEKRYRFTDKVPTLVVFNAAHAAINVDSMNEERVLDARTRTQTLLREFVATFHPDLSDSITFQNDRSWDQHNDFALMMVLYSRYLTSRHSNMGSVWNNLEQFGGHHQHEGKQVHVINGMSPSETYGSLHPFFFQDPQQAHQPAELLPDPGIMEEISAPRHVIFHQGPPEIQFGALRKVWAEDATAKGLADWLAMRHDTAANLRSYAEEIMTGYTGNNSVEFAAHAKTIASKAPKKVGPLLVRMIKAIEDDAGYASLWARQIAEIDIFASERVPDLIQAIRQRRGDIGSRHDAIRVAMARNDGTVYGLLSDQLGQAALQRPRKALELTVSVGTIPVYYPLKEVDQVVDANSENPTLIQYQDFLAQTMAKTKRIRGNIEYANKNLLSTLRPLNNESDQSTTQVQLDLHEQIKSLYARVEEEEQRIASQGRRATQEEVEAKAAYMREHVEVIKAHATSSLPRIPNSSAIVAEIFHQTHADILRERAVAETKARAVLQDFRLLLKSIDPDPKEAARKYGELLDRIKQGMAAHVQEQVVAYL